MTKLITSLVVLVTPATAMAHPGHPHVGSELGHHVLEYAGIGAAAVIAIGCARYVRARWASRRAS